MSVQLFVDKWLCASCTSYNLIMAAILRPEVLWIEGRCYRINDSTTEITSLQEYDLYENDTSCNYELDEGDEDDIEVVMVDNSRYKSSLHISKHYLGCVIGKKGSTKSRIERDTRTDINIPRPGHEGDITIFGETVANVRAARRRINMVVMSSRMKQKSTHFLSIPMNSLDIVRRFEEFKRLAISECNINESLFIKPQKLHITIGMMCLMDNEERLLASELLTEAKDKIVVPLLQGLGPVKIRLKGVSYMNDDPSQVNVLYGTIQEEDPAKGLIQKIADGLVEHFTKAGYILASNEFRRDNVKLHVTLMNSKYASRPNDAMNNEADSSRKSKQLGIPFDGSQVLKKFADFDFGVMELKHIHLSQRHSTGADQYYAPTCIVNLV